MMADYWLFYMYMLCCFALFVCLTFLASFFHLSLTTCIIYSNTLVHVYTCIVNDIPLLHVHVLQAGRPDPSCGPQWMGVSGRHCQSEPA